MLLPAAVVWRPCRHSPTGQLGADNGAFNPENTTQVRAPVHVTWELGIAAACRHASDAADERVGGHSAAGATRCTSGALARCRVARYPLETLFKAISACKAH